MQDQATWECIHDIYSMKVILFTSFISQTTHHIDSDFTWLVSQACILTVKSEIIYEAIQPRHLIHERAEQ